MHPDLIANPRYRFVLSREITPQSRLYDGTVCWVMLNPSTADDLIDDPTIRKIKHLSAMHGFHRLAVVNLFAARSTKPRHLVEMGQAAMGGNNSIHIAAQARQADAIVLAWGNSVPRQWEGYASNVADRLSAMGKPVLCCGRNANGSPKHPCYLPNDTKLVPW